MQRFKCRGCGHLFQNGRAESPQQFKCPRCLSQDIDRILDTPAEGEKREVPDEKNKRK